MDEPASWTQPPPNLLLEPGQVHLWRVGLSSTQAHFAGLSADERQRAEKFRFERDRDRFVAARGTLRRLVGQYLSIPEHEIEFAYSNKGKPFLKRESWLKFNLSHAGAYALYAFTHQQEVGIDIEKIVAKPDLPGVAKRFFSVREQNALFLASNEGWNDAFFHIWTQKEAYIKAVGDGLGIPLDSFDVQADPLRCGKITVGKNWQVYSFIPAGMYRAAVCTEGDAALSFYTVMDIYH